MDAAEPAWNGMLLAHTVVSSKNCVAGGGGQDTAYTEFVQQSGGYLAEISLLLYWYSFFCNKYAHRKHNATERHINNT